MKFGEIPLDQAEGTILAHSLAVEGGRIRKGRVLTATDVERLAAAGIARVTVARLEGGDLDEDQAAARLAAAVADATVDRSTAATGRVNLSAHDRGLVLIDKDRIDRINNQNEALTVATVRPFALAEPEQMIATVKVVSFGLPESVVAAAEAVAREAPAPIRVAPLHAKRIGLIQTRLSGLKPSILDKTIEVTAARLSALGCSLARDIVCAHDTAAVAKALKRLKDDGCEIVLVLGASAIVDRRDVVPSAMIAAGGTIDHFGMPVDPGNLMLLAALDGMRVLGLPGSGRSPRLHGFDWVLWRLLADQPVSGQDLMAMGVGGLLKEIPSRPLPRARAAPKKQAPTRRGPPRIAAVVLAAGQSRRMGARNKLLEHVDGEAMLCRVVDAALASRAEPVIVVTGHQADRVADVLGDRAVTRIHNPDYADGLSTSLGRGLAALGDEVDAALVCLGDMPRLTAGHIDRLIDAFDPEHGVSICVPTFAGKRGNPVLWDRRYFPEMQRLSGDVGARHLIGEHADQVAEVSMDDDGILMDVDSPEALAALTR